MSVTTWMLPASPWTTTEVFRKKIWKAYLPVFPRPKKCSSELFRIKDIYIYIYFFFLTEAVSVGRKFYNVKIIP